MVMLGTRSIINHDPVRLGKRTGKYMWKRRNVLSWNPRLEDLHKLDGNGLNEEVRSIVRKLELAEAMQVK
jgi:hypothetical protein